ncbi:MAG: AgmX/PglI C-terminal domain-containing protein [Polyangiaceae bacterium]
MRRSNVLGGLLLVAVISMACGGGTPAPNSADKTGSTDGGGGATAAPSASSVLDLVAASSGTTPSPAGSASAATSGAPAQDDVWLAYHQMAQKDLLVIVRGAQGRIQSCFRAGLKRDRSLSGETKIKFVVSHVGAVKAWKDEESSMSDEEVTKCIGEVINSLNFKTQKSPGDAWGIYTVKYGI